MNTFFSLSQVVPAPAIEADKQKVAAMQFQDWCRNLHLCSHCLLPLTHNPILSLERKANQDKYASLLTWIVEGQRAVLESLFHYQLTSAWFFWVRTSNKTVLCVSFFFLVPSISLININSIKISQNDIMLAYCLFRLQSPWKLHHSTLLGHQKSVFLAIPQNVYSLNIVSRNYLKIKHVLGPKL